MSAALPLADLPGPAFKAVLVALPAPDLGSLRLASTQLAKLVTGDAPRLVLRLGPATSRDALLAWSRATRRLQHVEVVEVLLRGSVDATVFSLAMRLLGVRGRVTHLALCTPGNDACRSGGGAVLASLRPALHHLRASLTRLRVGPGVAVASLAADLAELLPLQLETLELAGPWTSPGSEPLSLAAWQRALQRLPAACPRLRSLELALPPVPRWAAGPGQAGDAGQLAAASVATLGGAVAKLATLEALALRGLPDLWAPRPAGSCAGTAAAGTAAAGAAAAGAAAAVAAALAGAGAMPAMALTSLEGAGTWLFAQLPRLAHLHLETAGASWALTWALQPGDLAAAQLAAAAAAAAAGAAQGLGSAPAASPLLVLPAPAIAAMYHATAATAGAATAGAATSGCSSSSSSSSLATGLATELARYSPRPACQLLPRIARLQLALQPPQLGELAGLLETLPGLRDLKLTALATSSAPVSLDALATAAAAAPQLTSLVLLPGLGEAQLGAATLAPLAAAGRLQRLRLVGTFSTAAAAGPAAAWAPLRRLASLRELRVHQLGGRALALPLSCLPPGLASLHVRGVQLAGTSCGAALASLHLEASSVQPAALASSRLEQLGVVASELGPGGWASAAAAWPHLSALTAARPLPGCAAAAELGGWRRLRTVRLQAWPSCSPGDLLAALPGLKQLELASVAPVGPAEQRRWLAALQAHSSSSSSSLVHLALRLPAGALPPAVLPLVGQQSLAASAHSQLLQHAGLEVGLAERLPWASVVCESDVGAALAAAMAASARC